MKQIKIILAGGGTGGSVSPLLAVAEQWRRKYPQTEFLFLGTASGPEKTMTRELNIPFKCLYSGKWRRYFSWRNFLAPVEILIGFFQAFYYLVSFSPDLILTAGSYLAVPVVWAGWLLRIPSFLHQQDIQLGLANKLMAPFACKITVTLEKSLKDFPAKKSVWTGNPVRPEILQGGKDRAIQLFKLDSKLPVVLILGGGTGSLKINQTVITALSQLTTYCQLIHLTGEKKSVNIKPISQQNYHPWEFLQAQELADVYTLAEVVVSRAGLATLNELAILGKPVIVIPLANSHQVKNAEYFQAQRAVEVLPEAKLAPAFLSRAIQALLNDPKHRKELSCQIQRAVKKDGAEKVLLEIEKFLMIND